MISQEKKLLDLLSNNDVTFFIPPYQRNYEWTDEQCKVFLEDVIKTCESNQFGEIKEHFFGSITYFQNETPFGQPNRLVLIDGQQRVTTTMLFLVALRDILQDEGLKKYVDSKYLKNENVSGDSEYKIKLKQVETDWQAYKNIILAEKMSEKEKDSSVYRNYNYFYNKLVDYQNDGNSLDSLIDKGINKFSVITIELQPNKNKWENPQEIFESMNSLGKPLSLADLVRNYLLLGLDADTQTDLYNKYWLHIESVIPHKVSDFIRDFMQGLKYRSYPKATETNYKVLYSMFKELFDGCDPTSLLKDLSDYADIYRMVIEDESCGNKEIDRLLGDLRKINITTAYSFLLVLLRTWKNQVFTDKDVAEILDAFRIYCFRKRVLGITQAENKIFPTLAGRMKELADAENKRLQMFKILSKQEHKLRLPNDIELTRYIKTMNFYNFRNCKLFLALIEEKLTKSRPDLTDSKLQIEHIMPQTLSDSWKQVLGPEHDTIHQEYVHTIGNLTLIRHNQELGQKDFVDKKDVYENNAGLQIARTKITEYTVWNKKSIEERADWIIEYLLQKVLPIPDSMRKTNNFSVKEGKGLSFEELQLIGLSIEFVEDSTISAQVVSDKEVEFEGKKWKLSPLTKELKIRNGTVNNSGSYQGAAYWSYDGIKLSDIL